MRRGHVPSSDCEDLDAALSGDRQLNRALHVIALSRTRYDQATRDYIDRRRAQGKTDREIRRCLKRYIARDLFRQLEHGALPA